MSAPGIVRGTEYFARPGHIHHTGQATAHHARFQLPGGSCSPVYGPDSFAGLRPIEWLKQASRADHHDCILWPFSKTSAGYPLVVDGRSFRARGHRLVCEWVHGDPASPEMQAAHACGQKLCVNPKHLRWATPVENTHDKFAHGTMRRGVDVHTSKLNENDVREIRRLYATGEWSMSALGRRFGIRRNNISGILKREKWGWLHD